MRRRGTTWLWALALLAVAGLRWWVPAALSLVAGAGGSSSNGTTSTSEVVAASGQPVDPDLIEAWLDPTGRPYDVTGAEGYRKAVLSSEPITTFTLDAGAVRTMAGEAVGFPPEGQDPEVRFEAADEIELSQLRVGVPGQPELTDPIGIRLDVAGTEVARWRSFEPAYGTDGGMGAVTTAEAYERLGDADFDAIIDDLDDDGLALLSLSGDEPDALVFDNGYGDGGYPMSRGVDDQGRTVSLIIWSVTYPWRLAVPDGVPPPDVTRQEEQVQECLDGERPLLRVTYDDPDGNPVTATSCQTDE